MLDGVAEAVCSKHTGCSSTPWQRLIAATAAEGDSDVGDAGGRRRLCVVPPSERQMAGPLAR